MSVIYKHQIRIYRRPTKWSFSADEVSIKQEKILAQNERYIVIDDDFYTKLEKKGDGRCWNALEKPSINFKDMLGEQGVFYTLYSFTKKRTSTIQKEIRAKAEKEYGWLFSKELDLSRISSDVVCK